MGVTIAPAAGPVLGGWLTDQYGWPVDFLHQPAARGTRVGLSIIVLNDRRTCSARWRACDVIGIILLGWG